MPRLPMIIFIALLLWLSPIDGARTYIVDDSGFANYNTIQEAVVAAKDGDRIYIKPGTYNEEVVLNKSLGLMPLTGESGPIILRGDGKKTGITITAEGCSLEGLTLQNFTGPGIRVQSSGNIIKGNRFERDNPAILVVDSHLNTITKNNMQNCEGGVALWENSSNNSVLENEIYGGVVSIFIRDAGKNHVAGNLGKDASIGVWVMNGSNADIAGNDLTAKTYGLWLLNSSASGFRDNSLAGCTYGIYLTNSTGQEINNNSIKDAKFGIVLENSSRNLIKGCSVENSTRALGLAASFDNTIIENKILDTADTAMEISFSRGNFLADNSVTKSDRGAILVDSPGNRLESNRFQDVNWGLYAESESKEGFNNSIDESNLVNGNPISYLFGRSGEVIKNREIAHLTLAYCNNITVENTAITRDALFLFYSKDNKILDNNISGCFGMRLVQSSENEILGNRLLGNRYSGMFLYGSDLNLIADNNASENKQNGISLLSCNQNTIRDNIVDQNDETGVWLNISNDNQIFQNNITGNPLGLQVIYSTGNKIYHNNFIGNKEHSQDIEGNNYWDEGNVTGGNFWSGHVAKGNPSLVWPRMIKGGSMMDNYPFQDESGWLKASAASPSSTANA